MPSSNGQFWYGYQGFLYKKNGGGGARRVFPYGLLCNKPTNLYNKYTPGSGVGATSTSIRRAKLIKATSCNNNNCSSFYSKIGINWNIVSNNTKDQ